MLECETGPSRRVSTRAQGSRYSKRNSGDCSDKEGQSVKRTKLSPEPGSCDRSHKGKQIRSEQSTSVVQSRSKGQNTSLLQFNNRGLFTSPGARSNVSKVSPVKQSDWFSNSFGSREKLQKKTSGSNEAKETKSILEGSTCAVHVENQLKPELACHSSTEIVASTDMSSSKPDKGGETVCEAMDPHNNSDLLLAEMDLVETADGKSSVCGLQAGTQATEGGSRSKYFMDTQDRDPSSKPGTADGQMPFSETQTQTQSDLSRVPFRHCVDRICTPFNFSAVACDTQCTDADVSVYGLHDNSLLPATAVTSQLTQRTAEAALCDKVDGTVLGGTDKGSTGHRPPDNTGGTQFNTSVVTQANGFYTSTQCNNKQINSSVCDVFNDSFQDPDLLSQIEKIDESGVSNGMQNATVTGTGHMSDSVKGSKKESTNKTISPDKSNAASINRGKDHETTDRPSACTVAKSGKQNVKGKEQKQTSLKTTLCSKTADQDKDKERGCEVRVDSMPARTVPKTNSELSSSRFNRQQETRGENSWSHGSRQAAIPVAKAPSYSVTMATDNKQGTTPTTPVGSTRSGLRLGSSSTPRGAGGSLQESIKRRLKENAGQKTPQGPAHLVNQLREQLLERVQTEMTAEQGQHREQDIGPFYGLPSKVQRLFESERGITRLYDWQEECLALPAVGARRNLIYSLPTSGGKTLVAEILILRELLCRKKDAILVLPFVSIVQEKVRNLSQFAVELDFLVEEYAGSKGRFPPTKRRTKSSLYIATIEKAHSIVNSLIEKQQLDNIGLVVVDELHMIGEGGGRGATLESTLMKLLHIGESTQIIGMSATLNNIEDLTRFLHADIYSSDFRPVELTECLKLGENIYTIDSRAKCPEDQFLHDRVVVFQYSPEMNKADPDHLLGLAVEVIPDNSCLVFCPTKKNCENVAMMLCKLMVKHKREMSDVKKAARKSLLRELYSDNEGKICPVLQYTVHFGVAYHHSGLTMDERKLVEEAYAEGTLCLLTCTSTLAAGVNLPAKRVILRSPYVGQNFISRSQYKQMVGRAGRAGIDTSGESILICKTSDREKVCSLLAGPVESCCSSLMYDGGKGIRNLILSTVGLKVATTTEDVFRFVRQSLVHVQREQLRVDISEVCRDALQKLIDMKLVLQKRNHGDNITEHSLEVTDLGRATFKGPVDPDYASMLYEDLTKAEESLVLSCHLHLLYLVTPYDMASDITPSWFVYFNQMNTLNSVELKVASSVGVPEAYIAMRASNRSSRLKVDGLVVNRFFLTLILYELWRQRTVWDVAERFQMPRGFIQNLLSSAASFATCVLHFCQELDEFWAYQELLGNFVKRLSYCVQSELIPLMEIPGVKQGRAKLMYNAGFTTLSAVAAAEAESLVKSVDHMPRKVARQIVASAQALLNERADAMIEEVVDLVAIPGKSASLNQDHLSTPMLPTPGPSQETVASYTSDNSQ